MDDGAAGDVRGVADGAGRDGNTALDPTGGGFVVAGGAFGGRAKGGGCGRDGAIIAAGLGAGSARTGAGGGGAAALGGGGGGRLSSPLGLPTNVLRNERGVV
jgi:hypothetical protein